MTDFKKLLENGCMVETHINYTNHLTDKESAVLSILTTHQPDNEWDSMDFTSSYEMDLVSLLDLTQLTEKMLIKVLKSLEKKGHIEGCEDFEQIIIHLKPYNCNSKI